MMKRVIILFCLIVIYIMSFVGYANAAIGKWYNPTSLKTYIQPGHKRTVMMKHAFAEWSRLTNNRLVFRYVNSPRLAQIKVYFVKKIDVTEPNLDKSIGLTRSRTTGHAKQFTRAEIYIADQTQDGRTLSNDEVYTVMLHEIGHAVGLEHSKNPKSVMYLGADVIQEISKADLETLAKLYGWRLK